MIREMIGANVMASALGSRRNRKIMASTMVGIVGTAVGLGAAYMMMRNKKMHNDM